MDRLAAIALLDSLAASYPGGVPLGEIARAKARPEAAPGPCIVFVAAGAGEESAIGFAGAEGELLAAAASKGLKLPADAAAALFAGQKDLSSARIGTAVARAAATGVIVAMGEPVWRAFSGGGAVSAHDWISWEGRRVRATWSPAEILKDPAKKREFWEDLKAVLPELKI